ncbi:hypothetical protein [Miniphocaeibacter halophilus]|uniref:Uncharacterized protein n=1 Tax=Miniphocaeibacter halophilus TaxID=2931922 RepID=A0AC61MQY0_9FIRM|nr:hypothetical protein [Miniphocaeibacter halophilus]QQK07349.1 hypothetical protein JFY71_08485 [Miniphocaeibacter halophilus]
MKKKLTMFLIIEVLILLIFNIFEANIFNMEQIVFFPYYQISNILRSMSISGSIGNIISWAIYILISIIPIIIFVKIKRRNNFKNIDYLLLFISLLIFLTIYVGINPNIIEIILKQNISLQISFPIITNQLILLYIIWRFLKIDINRSNSIKYIIGILFLTNVIAVINIFGVGLKDNLNNMETLSYYGNTISIFDYLNRLKEKYMFAIDNYELIRIILDFINNNIFNIMYIFLNMNLIYILIDMENKFSENTAINKLYSLKNKIKLGLLLSIFINIIINLVYIIFEKHFYNITIKINFNLELLVYFLFISLIVQYLIKVKEIKDENKMFI